MTKESHVDEMRRAAASVDPETMIGLCEGGFPITGDACQFCGATWKDKCGRADRELFTAGERRE